MKDLLHLIQIRSQRKREPALFIALDSDEKQGCVLVSGPSPQTVIEMVAEFSSVNDDAKRIILGAARLIQEKELANTKN